MQYKHASRTRWAVAILLLLTASAGRAQQAPSTRGAPLDSSHALQLPRYRYRLMGVYDETSGEPIDSVLSLTRFRGRLTRSKFGAEVAHEIQEEGSVRRAA